MRYVINVYNTSGDQLYVLHARTVRVARLTAGAAASGHDVGSVTIEDTKNDCVIVDMRGQAV